MNRQYNVSHDGIIKAFMYAHYQSCGWDYCVLIYDAWKFISTLKLASIHVNSQEISDYLITECPTIDDAINFCNTLPDDLPRVSTWEKGRLIYNNKHNKEKQNG